MGHCQSEERKDVKKLRMARLHRKLSSSLPNDLKSANSEKEFTSKDRAYLKELFEQFDKDQDNYLNMEELSKFWEYLCRKKHRQIQIDQDFIGHFLTRAGVLEQTRISKFDFIDYFSRQ